MPPISRSALLLGGVAALGAVAAATVPGTSGLLVRFVLVVVGVVLVAVGIRRQRPAQRRPWVLLLAGLSASLAGDAGVLVAAWRQDLTANLPVDIWLTALAGLLVLAGMVDATRIVRGTDPGGTLDALVVAIAGGTLLWHLTVVQAAAPGWAGSRLEIAGSVQVLSLVAVLALLIRTRRLLPPERRTATTLLTVALVAALWAFLLGATRDAAGGMHHYVGLRAGLGVVANLAVGAAAMHPSMRALTEPMRTETERLTPARTATLAVALLVPPALLVVGPSASATPSLGLVAAWFALVPTVLLRLHLLVRVGERARDDVVDAERRLLSLVAHTGDLLLLVNLGFDGTARIAYASPAAMRLLGRDPDELVDTPPADLAVSRDGALLHTTIGRVGTTGPATADVQLQRRDGSTVWVEAVVDRYLDDPFRVVVTLRDIGERKQVETRWLEAAQRDELTGLLNRRGLEAELTLAQADARGGGRRRLAVLACDLDGFKAINDHHGHAAGDDVLREVARRLRGVVRDDDLVARLGGDEFVVVCHRAVERAAVAGIADRVLRSISEPMDIGAGPLSVGISVGIAIGPAGTTDTALRRAADAALYRAKAAGKARIAWADDHDVGSLPAVPVG